MQLESRWGNMGKSVDVSRYCNTSEKTTALKFPQVDNWGCYTIRCLLNPGMPEFQPNFNIIVALVILELSFL